MPHYAARFAAALTVRENVLNIALRAAYANGNFPNTLPSDLAGIPDWLTTNANQELMFSLFMRIKAAAILPKT